MHAPRTPRLLGITARTAGLSIAGLLLFAFGLRFWLHDAFPYVVDYAEGTYRRYWQVRQGLLLHIAGGTVALLAGPFQLWSGFQRRFRRTHRGLGYAYISSIALSATSSFYLAMFSSPDFGLSLSVLAVMWLVSVAMALVAIRNKRIDAHREWMVRSYIATFSFASYRYLVKMSIFDPLLTGRAATVLWISWVVPMMCYELYLQRDRVKPLRRRAAAPSARDFV